MSERRLSIPEATEIVRNRLNVSADKAQALLLDADASKKVHIFLDQNVFTEQLIAIQQAQASRAIVKTIGSQQAAVASSAFANSGSALAVLRESAERGAVVLSLLIQYGQVSQDELLNWLGSISEPDLNHLKQAKQADILKAARAVCFDPKYDNPNTTDAEPLVKQWLAAQGLKATRKQIRPILNCKEFVSRRTKAGYAKRN